MGEELDRDHPPEGQVITPSGQPKSTRRPCSLEGGCRDRGSGWCKGERVYNTLSTGSYFSVEFEATMIYMITRPQVH